MNSALYECEVLHRRLLPRVHQFSYRIFLFSIDLSELDQLDRTVWGFRHGRRAFYSFLDRDHLAPNDVSVRQKLTTYLAAQGVALPADASVRLITLPRVLGYIFNPVSFFYCYEASGRPLCAVVEVGNTFREMKLYCIPGFGESGRFHRRVAKEFYVSPFSSLDTEFDFRLRLPDERLSVRIDDYEGGKRSLVSAVMGLRRPLTSRALWLLTVKYPFITARVIFLIHWHALLLWLKRVPFIQKTDRPEAQKEVLRPHRSLIQP